LLTGLSALLVAGAYWLSTQSALDVLLGRAVARSEGRLTVEGATGSLLSTVHIDRLRWKGDEVTLDATGVALTWSPTDLLSRRFNAKGFGAQRLIVTLPAPSGGAIALPSSLALPLEVTIVQAGIGRIDWRAGEMLVRAKGRQRVRMPIPPDVGTAVVAYLRDTRPNSSCRRLFVRTLAPHVGFASGCAITMIAKAALDRVGIKGCAHRGAHIFRHSLATELLRSGATLSEIGQLLRHESHDTTRIYAKVDIETLRTLSLPWPGGAQ
jgi:hypothetical protein